MILGLSVFLMSGCNQSQINDLKKRVSSANSSPNSNSTTANNSTTTNTNVNSNGNSSNNVDSVANTNNPASNTAAKKEFNIESFFGSYLGFDNIPTSTAGTPLAKYNLTKPAVVSRVDGETVKIANFGGFDSFINVKIKPSSTEGVSDIEFTDPGGRKFKGTANFSGNKITGQYRVTYTDNTFDDADFEYTKQN